MMRWNLPMGASSWSTICGSARKRSCCSCPALQQVNLNRKKIRGWRLKPTLEPWKGLASSDDCRRRMSAERGKATDAFPQGQLYLKSELTMPAPFIRVLGPQDGMFAVELGNSLGGSVVIFISQEVG